MHGFRVDVDEGGGGCGLAVLDLRGCWCAGLRGGSLEKARNIASWSGSHTSSGDCLGPFDAAAAYDMTASVH